MIILQVEGNPSLVRDTETNAILNTNLSEYDEYIRNKTIALQKVSQAEQQQQDINMLKRDMLEIKQMLSMLVKGKE
jgi:hypothetical protein